MTARVAVVGLGYFSRYHLDAWAYLPGAELVATADPAPARTAGVPHYGSLSELLHRHDPDIVDIVAPPPSHADLIRTALAPGRTVICQKPFATSSTEALELTEEAEQVETDLIIHENFRFQPWYRTLKDLQDEGLFDTVYQARFALRPGDGRGPQAYLDRQPAFQTMPRLLIHETGGHFIDLFRWLFGEITHVYADLRRRNPVLAGEDGGLMILDHAGGTQSILDGNRLSDHVSDDLRRTMGELEIEAEAGTLRLDGSGALHWRDFGQREWTDLPLRYALRPGFGGGAVEALCAHVLAARRSEAELENRARDYLPVIDVIDAAYRSDADGRKMTISAANAGVVGHSGR